MKTRMGFVSNSSSLKNMEGYLGAVSQAMAEAADEIERLRKENRRLKRNIT